jgi:hypothetical protein
MRVSEMFKRRFVKASDVEEQPLTLTISGVEAVELEEGTKYAVSFEESEMELILNVTNARTIEKLYGGDTEAWTGKKIMLFAQQVDFRGEQVLAVRVSLKKPEVSGGPSGNETLF